LAIERGAAGNNHVAAVLGIARQNLFREKKPLELIDTLGCRCCRTEIRPWRRSQESTTKSHLTIARSGVETNKSRNDKH
jgi:hypothetical protein